MTDEELAMKVAKDIAETWICKYGEALRERCNRQFVENKLPGILNAINGVADQEDKNNTESQNPMTDEEFEKLFSEMSAADKIDFIRQYRAEMRAAWWEKQKEPMYEDLRRVAGLPAKEEENNNQSE